MSAAVVAFGAVSAMGEGLAAASAGTPGERARVVIQVDEELTLAGLARPHAARVALPPGGVATDRATAILSRALALCIDDLEVAVPEWRSLRVGLALGTSSGGMRSKEAFFERCLAGETRDPESAAAALYWAPMRDVVRGLGRELEPVTQIMGACAAGALAVGVGLRWLGDDACDIALVGGFDAVAVFVAAGFEVLRATTAQIPPRPFRLGRDGMSLGEGAALLALRPSHVARSARVHVTGFAASSDAVHLTAPDREGRGLASSAKRALAEAGISSVDLVSPHGSATPFSDAAEARALRAALGDTADRVVVHPLKAQIGHTLGASGALELLACVDALTRGVYAAAAGEGAIDPDARVNLLDVARAGSPATALKLSAAFGGANAAIALSRAPSPVLRSSNRHSVYLGAAIHLSEAPTADILAAHIGWPIERVQRADGLTRCVLAAVAALVLRDGPLTGAGIIVGTAFATTETNASFFARIRERGARMAEPRRFPYTSPNASAGDASAAFGLTGPSFAVGCGVHAGVEALAVAAELVRSGDAEKVVVVAVEEIGLNASRIAAAIESTVSSGAVALVVSSDRAGAVAEVTSARCGIGPRPRRASSHGMTALLPLTRPDLPERSVLEASCPGPRSSGDSVSTAWARVELRRLPER